MKRKTLRKSSMTIRHANSTWSLLSWSTPLTKRKRKSSSEPSRSPPRRVSAENLIDINNLDSKGRSLLFYAARCDQPEVAIQLLAAGCDPNIGDNNRDTPLHEAAENGHVDVVKVLLKHGSCDIDAKNCEGHTPLMKAVAGDGVEIVKLLHKAGSDINTVDHLGKSAILIGLQEGAEKSCLYLMKAGCDVNAMDLQGHSALFYAVNSSRLSTLDLAKKIVKSGYATRKDATWLIDSSHNENCLLVKDVRFYRNLLSKIGIKQKQEKADIIQTLKVTFKSSVKNASHQSGEIKDDHGE